MHASNALNQVFAQHCNVVGAATPNYCDFVLVGAIWGSACSHHLQGSLSDKLFFQWLVDTFYAHLLRVAARCQVTLQNQRVCKVRKGQCRAPREPKAGARPNPQYPTQGIPRGPGKPSAQVSRTHRIPRPHSNLRESAVEGNSQELGSSRQVSGPEEKPRHQEGRHKDPKIYKKCSVTTPSLTLLCFHNLCCRLFQNV